MSSKKNEGENEVMIESHVLCPDDGDDDNNNDDNGEIVKRSMRVQN